MKFNSISEIEVGDYVTIGSGKKIIEITELHATYTNYVKGVYVESGKVIKDHYSYFSPAPEQNTRVAYDKGMEDRLEQVIEWIKNCRDYDLLYIKDRALMIRELREAMRPTQEDN
jgi:hypothetical protein